MLFIRSLMDIGTASELRYNYGDNTAPWRYLFLRHINHIQNNIWVEVCLLNVRVVFVLGLNYVRDVKILFS